MRPRSWRTAILLAAALSGAAAAQPPADPPPDTAATPPAEAVALPSPDTMIDGTPLPAGAADCRRALAAAEATAEPGAERLYYVIDYCPAFAAALASSPWSANLPIDTDYLDRAGVDALIELAAGYEPARPDALAVDRLDAIVTALEPFVPEPEPTLWQRIMEWLNELIGGGDGDETWFGRWLGSLSIPESWIEPILYTIAAITVLTVLAIVINELRLGGAFLGRTTRALRSATAGPGLADLPPPTIEAIRREPRTGRKVELMLALIVDRMRRRYAGLLRPSLTHRELARAAAELDADARASLSRVAGAAERVTYADWEPDEASWQQILASGESLIRRIDEGDGATA